MSQSNWSAIGSRLIKVFYFKDYDSIIPFVKNSMQASLKLSLFPMLIVNSDHVKVSITDGEEISKKCHALANEIDSFS